MANNDGVSTVSRELPGTVVKQLESPTNAVLSSEESAPGNLPSSSTSSAPAVTPPASANSIFSASDNKSSTTSSTEDSSTSHPTRPVLVQLGSSATTQSSSAAPKRYSSSNINKKFLEKNTSTSTSLPVSSSSNSLKAGGTPTRPAAQSISSHPRLVTTKLTATPQSSSTPGPGWSRPSSVTPPVASTPNGISNLAPTPSQTSAPVSVPAAPQLPHAGKVIQPQPRSAGQLSALQKDGGISGGGGSTKPVWGNIKPAAGTTRADARVQSDFPTAAEVAQGSTARKGKGADQKELEMAEASKQARLEEADTFRGVHLDPNAHHWDEMEEDDDNFLDGVIEFGDGRQYKIDTNNAPASPPTKSPIQTSFQDGARTENLSMDSPTSNGPVSKEERFVDDFDRSWPRTKNSSSFYVPDFAHTVSGGQRPNTVGQPSSPASSSASPALSPQESSRVLFNERSNKLEPYSNSHRPGAGPYQLKRGHHPDHTLTDSRTKPSGEGPRGRGNGSSFGPGSLEKHKDRDGPHSSATYAPASPRSEMNSLPPTGKDRDFLPARHQSSMGPPPVPLHAARGPNFRDGGRQLPPHLSQGPPHTALPVERRQSSRDSRYPQSARPPSSSRSSVRHPSQSPALSHAAAVTSPVIEPGNIQLSAAELEDVTKDLMHSAAARAKQRRQQEEEERERERERARRKAAEIEERMQNEKRKNETAQSATRTNHQIQDEITLSVVDGADSKLEKAQPQADHDPAYTRPLRRPPSLIGSPFQSHDTSRPPFARRTSVSSSTASTSANLPPSAATESWRIKAHPLPSAVTPRPPQARSRASSAAQRSSAPLLALPSALDQVESLAEDTTDLEVVDYSDLGKFVGVSDISESGPSETPEISLPLKIGRPVASDFFDDEHPATEASIAKSGIGPWRRSKQDATKVVSPSSQRDIGLSTSAIPDDTSKGTSQLDSGRKRASDLVVSAPPTEVLSADHHPLVNQSHSGSSRSSRTQSHYKEATMSALDDTMSRIKGVLDVMHEKDHVPSSEPDYSPKLVSATSKPPSQRWIPPALRERHVVPQPQEEDFLSTCAVPPRSPKPAWNSFTIRLPRNSIALEPVSKKQIAMFYKPQPVRWDILSFTPPVEGMNRRDFSLNDVLFRRSYSYGYKGKIKYRVLLPKKSPGSIAPRVNLLPSRPAAGAFGRPTAADGALTWRRTPSIATAKADAEYSPAMGLDTTSKSPPPEPDAISKSRNDGETPKNDESSPTPMRSRSQPKMPAGSGVAFYRDSRVVDIRSESKPSVSFFATSELEVVSPGAAKIEAQPDVSAPSSSTVSNASPNGEISSVNTVKPSPVKSSPSSSQYGLPSLIQRSESKSSEDSPDHVPITPPSHHAAPWPRSSLTLTLKDSPVRAPDPEHLKAVWSQTSNKAGLPAINSLEGIVDDLTSVPFTIQDVKSEDGETPPPTTSTAPSRMSLHDVTRAFQQVPSSSSIPSHRPTISPPSTTAPVARPSQNYGYPPVQPPNPNVRPPYPSYASPMLSHSPAPGTVYSHPSPMPNRMQVNGHTPLYSPVWVPLPNPTTQNSGNVIRHIASPYPPQMMHYPSPGTQPIYGMPPNMQTTQMQNGTPNRNRTVSMMSPVMPHSVAVPQMPMYPGSPVMVPAPAHAGRGGPIRNDGNHTSLPQHQPQTSTHSHQPQPYAPLSTTSFTGVRPTW